MKFLQIQHKEVILEPLHGTDHLQWQAKQQNVLVNGSGGTSRNTQMQQSPISVMSQDQLMVQRMLLLMKLMTRLGRGVSPPILKSFLRGRSAVFLRDPCFLQLSGYDTANNQLCPLRDPDKAKATLPVLICICSARLKQRMAYYFLLEPVASWRCQSRLCVTVQLFKMNWSSSKQIRSWKYPWTVLSGPCSIQHATHLLSCWLWTFWLAVTRGFFS